MHLQQIFLPQVALVAPLFNEYRVYYGQPTNMQQSEQYLIERLQNKESVIFAITVTEGEMIMPVGFTQLYPVYSSVRAVKNWVLNDLFVLETYRNKGYGKQLITAALSFAKTQNATYIQLETGEDNYGAQKLYEAIGFTKYNPHDGYFVYKINV